MEMTKRKLLIGARFLSFQLENENYCIEILKVRELMGMSDITPLPQTPPYIRGVINLRGQIIPIIDLRLKFGLPFKAYTKRTSIIVGEIDMGEKILMGLVVDSIQDVVSVPEEKIAHLPYVNAKIKADYIKGVATTQDGIKIVLDVEKILNDNELSALNEIKKSAETAVK